MAGTLGDMKTRIQQELARGAGWNPTAIANAINDAIKAYQDQRFRFSTIDPANPPTFNTVAGQWIYDVADNLNIPTAMQIDYVDMTIGTASVIKLIRETPETVKLYNQPTGTMMGQPSWFAYEGNKLLLAPVPAGVYTVTLGLFRNILPPASDAEANNPWMIDAEQLIRSRAKYEIAVNVTRNPTMAQAMSPDPPMLNGGVVGASYRAWKTLKSTSNRIGGLGRVQATQF